MAALLENSSYYRYNGGYFFIILTIYRATHI